MNISLVLYPHGVYIDILKMKKGHKVRHDSNLTRVAKIEGQVRGIGRMIDEGSYCVDILTQIQAAQSALGSLGRQVLRKHLNHCVTDALHSRSRADADEKIQELMNIIERKFS